MYPVQSMRTASTLFCFFILNLRINEACHIEFDQLDSSKTIRDVYEQSMLNITGQLQYCPTTIRIRNISITNPSLKRLSILNVSYFIEKNEIHLFTLPRLVGFASLTIDLYFTDEIEQRLTRRSIKNVTAQQKICEGSSRDRKTILRRCPTLKFRHGHYVLRETIHIATKRRQTIIDVLFTGVVMFLMTVGTLCIGCDLQIEQIVHNVKRPIPLIIGLVCQLLYLPLLSVLISKAFQLDNSTNLGLLSTASSPGGVSSNIYTALLAGDVDLSVTMTFFSTIVSFGTFPLWMELFGKDYVDFDRTKFPWWNMFLSLMTLCIPVLIGLLLRRHRPVLANLIGRFLNPIAIGYLVFILTFGVYINIYIFYIIDLRAIVACCLLPWFGFVGGAIISLLATCDKKRTIAICIETGIQNTAVAIFFLRSTFPQPESDIALANPILVSMAIPIPFIVLVLTKSMLRKFTPFQNYISRNKPKQNSQKPEETTVKELLEEKSSKQQEPTEKA